MATTTKLLLAFVPLCMMSTAALAQSSGPVANTKEWITQEKSGQWRATKLKGVDIYNDNNEKVGDVNDLIIDRSGKVDAVVIGVGGFLGIGVHEVAVPMNEIRWVDEPRAGTAANRPANVPARADTTSASPVTNNPVATGPLTSGAVSTNATTGSSAVSAGPADNRNRSYPDHGVLNVTKDQLRAAPEFKYAR